MADLDFRSGAAWSQQFVPAQPAWAGRLADFDNRIFGLDSWPLPVWEKELRGKDRAYLALTTPDPIRPLPRVTAIAGIRFGFDAEILTVAVAPERRRQGIARALVATLIEQARERDCEKVFLEVRAHSVGAIALYKSLGFEAISRRRHYYSDDDALVMRLLLKE